MDTYTNRHKVIPMFETVFGGKHVIMYGADQSVPWVAGHPAPPYSVVVIDYEAQKGWGVPNGHYMSYAQTDDLYKAVMDKVKQAWLDECLERANKAKNKKS